MPRGRLLPMLLLPAAMLACVDAARLSGPAATFPATVAFAPTFVEPVATSAPAAPVTHVRLEARNLANGAPLVTRVETVNPNASSWLFDLVIDVPAGETLQVDVLVVLLSGSQELSVAEWSGRSGRIALSASTPSREVQALPVYRGPPANLEVTAVEASLDGELLDGDRRPVRWSVSGPPEGARVFFTSLDPGVAVMEGDLLVTTGVGDARVVAEAGPAIDTLRVRVDAWPLPSAEELDGVAPGVNDSAGRLLGGLDDAQGAAAISAGLAAVSAAMRGSSAGDIRRAIDGARTAVENYAGGRAGWGAEGPELSLILHSLDVLEITLLSSRGDGR